jgi:hypothetical protein
MRSLNSSYFGRRYTLAASVTMLLLCAAVASAGGHSHAGTPDCNEEANCWNADKTHGVHCNDNEDCCGGGGLSPQCVIKADAKKCCLWYKAATTCNASQYCCGSYGPGANSVASCCDAGSACCTARVPSEGYSSCCPANTKCCGGVAGGLCCQLYEDCDWENSRCVPATSAPTDAQETSAAGSASMGSYCNDTTLAPATAAPTDAQETSSAGSTTCAPDYQKPTDCPVTGVPPAPQESSGSTTCAPDYHKPTDCPATGVPPAPQESSGSTTCAPDYHKPTDCPVTGVPPAPQESSGSYCPPTGVPAAPQESSGSYCPPTGVPAAPQESSAAGYETTRAPKKHYTTYAPSDVNASGTEGSGSSATGAHLVLAAAVAAVVGLAAA